MKHIEIYKPVWYPRFYITGPMLHFIWWRLGVSVFYWEDHSDGAWVRYADVVEMPHKEGSAGE